MFILLNINARIYYSENNINMEIVLERTLIFTSLPRNKIWITFMKMDIIGIHLQRQKYQHNCFLNVVVQLQINDMGNCESETT